MTELLRIFRDNSDFDRLVNWRNDMKKHDRCRMLADYMSIWLYSIGPPPHRLNVLYLNWLNTGKVPSAAEIERVIKQCKLELEQAS